MSSQPQPRTPVVVGLTGAIAMGKTFVGRAFRRAGAAVFDSDAVVHALLAPGGAAVGAVGEAVPGCEDGQGGIDRQRLGAAVFGDPATLLRLESVLHPLVFAAMRERVAQCARRGQRLVVLDVPLLFETGFDRWMDAVVAVSAPRSVQVARVMRRPAMTAERLAAIEANQFSDSLKCHLADFVVNTGRSRADTLRQVRRIAKVLKRESGHVWAPGWGR